MKEVKLQYKDFDLCELDKYFTIKHYIPVKDLIKAVHFQVFNITELMLGNNYYLLLELSNDKDKTLFNTVIPKFTTFNELGKNLIITDEIKSILNNEESDKSLVLNIIYCHLRECYVVYFRIDIREYIVNIRNEKSFKDVTIQCELDDKNIYKKYDPFEKVLCECGKYYTRTNKSQHFKSKYHNSNIITQL